MICRRFLAIFFPPAEYERVSFDAISENETFHGTNKYLVEQGYYEVFGFPDEDENAEKRVAAMSKLRQGECYSAQYEIRKGETTPPKRYTSGSIILAMEGAGTLIEDDELREQIKADGIGTSATRAEVIEKLLRLNYICVKDKKQVLVPSAFGEMIYEVVNVTLPELLSPEMTAKWEKGLDGIANGQIFKSDYEKELYTLPGCSRYTYYIFIMYRKYLKYFKSNVCFCCKCINCDKSFYSCKYIHYANYI